MKRRTRQPAAPRRTKVRGADLPILRRIEADEHKVLAPAATCADQSRGRARSEPPDPLRTAFQVDRDRILHSKAFRRLKHKTQVFLAPAGDHYRTRMTHTLEVGQIARTIARALALNDTLVEAISLGHDLGHTPFGHAGERVLNELLPGGFHHVKQSLRVVEKLERDGRGLNLTAEVLDGIAKHSKGKGAALGSEANMAFTAEGRIMRLADLIAYVNHDLDDAIRAGIMREGELPRAIVKTLGVTHSARITRMITDIVTQSDVSGPPPGHIEMSSEIYEALLALRDFLYERVYENPIVRDEFQKARKILVELYAYFIGDPERFFAQYASHLSRDEGVERAAGDFIAGMTDRYAMDLYREIFLPRPWPVR